MHSYRCMFCLVLFWHFFSKMWLTITPTYTTTTSFHYFDHFYDIHFNDDTPQYDFDRAHTRTRGHHHTDASKSTRTYYYYAFE